MSNDFDIIRGDDEDIVVTMTNSDDTAYDFTGCTLFFTMKENPDILDDNASLKKTITSFDAPTTGIQTIALTDEETGKLNIQDYYYDVQLKTALGKIKTFSIGKITVLSDVTLRTS